MLLRDVAVTVKAFIKRGSEYFRPDEKLVRSAFDAHAAGVCSLYLYNLPKLVTSNTAKVILAVTQDARLAEGHEIDRTIEVIQVPWFFAFESYWEAGEQTKKRQILDLLQEGLLWTAEHEGWQKQPLIEAYNACLSSDLVHERFWRKAGKSSWQSPDKRLKAKVLWKFGLESIEILAVFFDRNNCELGRRVLLSLIPSEHLLASSLGDAKWLSSKRFALVSRSKKKKWTVNVQDLAAE